MCIQGIIFNGLLLKYMLKKIKIGNGLLTLAIWIALFTMQVSEAYAQKNIEKGDELFGKNQFEEAIPFYTIEADDKKSKGQQEALLKLGKTYDILGRFLDSEKAYYKLYKLNPKDPENIKNYGLALKGGAKYDEAAKQFKTYIKLKPEDPMGKNYLESCYLAQLWLDENIQTQVRNLDSINTNEPDFAPVINNEKLYFASSKLGSIPVPPNADGTQEDTKLDLYKIDLTKPFNHDNLATSFSEINTAMHEGPATFSSDGNEMYFTRPVLGKRKKKATIIINPLQVFVTKKGGDGRWSTPVSAFSFNSNEYSVAHPSLSPDGKYIYFMSDMPGGIGGTDIYLSERQKDGTWGAAVNLGAAINTFGYELFPYIQNDSTLYFSSNIHPGLGKLDIFSASYVHGKWTDILNLKPPINSISDDFGIVFDGHYPRGFFSSARFNGHGKDDIYSFMEVVPMRFAVNGTKITFADQSLYDGSKFKLIDTETKEEIALNANEGLFSFDLKKDKEYTLTVRKEGFAYNKLSFKLVYNAEKNRNEIDVKANTKNIEVLGDFNEHNLNINNFDDFKGIAVLTADDKRVDGGEEGKYLLEKKNMYRIISKVATKTVTLKLDGIVKSASSHLIDKAQLFLSTGGKVIDSIYSNPKAVFNFNIESGKKYTITAIKPGYFQKDVEINAIDVVSIMIHTEIIMDSIELNKSVKIDNIYYDYNKADLRAKSLPELDKLIHFLHANPSLVIEISSHTDARGNDEYNLELSQHRAESVIKYLVSNGIPKAKLVAKGYGETMLIVAAASTEEEHQMNRRTEFKVLKIK
ncbi:MAG: hypothetical protein RL060_1616 [Bacteroidota bacterium]